MARHNEVGLEGELRAQAFLTAKGYHIRDNNWRCENGELDIVAEYDGMLVVVEVKSRSTLTFEHPKDAMTTAKIRRIVNATQTYIERTGVDLDVRFDVIGVYPKGQEFVIEHIEDAFVAPIN